MFFYTLYEAWDEFPSHMLCVQCIVLMLLFRNWKKSAIFKYNSIYVLYSFKKSSNLQSLLYLQIRKCVFLFFKRKNILLYYTILFCSIWMYTNIMYVCMYVCYVCDYLSCFVAWIQWSRNSWISKCHVYFCFIWTETEYGKCAERHSFMVI